MAYYLVGNTIHDDNLRPLVTLRPSVLGDVRGMFVPLSRSDARKFLDTLWEETYSMKHSSIPGGEVQKHTNWAEATFAWHLRILLQVTLCPAGCPKKPPHIHVNQERIDKLVQTNVNYERAFSIRSQVILSASVSHLQGVAGAGVAGDNGESISTNQT